MAENSVPPVPYKSPLYNKSGFISEAWATWFRQVFHRIGGNNALSNIELEEFTDLDISALDSRIDALETLTTSHTTSISSLQININDLNQGRQL